MNIFKDQNLLEFSNGFKSDLDCKIFSRNKGFKTVQT